jgi:hypothetical protein
MLNQRDQSKIQALNDTALLGRQAQALNCNAHAESCNTLCVVERWSNRLLRLNVCQLNHFGPFSGF